MNCRHCFEMHTLPDIEMYGGDTTPWEVVLMGYDGTRFSADKNAGCTSTLSITPFKVTSGFGNNATAVAPILTKAGTVATALDGGTTIMFEFDEADTKDLRGKFIYQIEVHQNEDLRLCQGTLYVKQNINR